MSSNATLANILSAMTDLSPADLETIIAVAQQRLAEFSTIANSVPEAKVTGGSLVQEYTKCGKPNCKCTRGELHGPYWWKYIYKPGGGQKRIYVGKNKPTS